MFTLKVCYDNSDLLFKHDETIRAICKDGEFYASGQEMHIFTRDVSYDFSTEPLEAAQALTELGFQVEIRNEK